MKPKIQVLGEAQVRAQQNGSQIKLTTFIPLKIKKRGGRSVVVRPINDPTSVHATTHTDAPLLVALSRAFYWQQLLDEAVVDSGSDIAKREGLHHSTVNELLRLTLLEPKIISDIFHGRQPRCMSLNWFQRNPLPVDWVAQREVVAEFDQ